MTVRRLALWGMVSPTMQGPGHRSPPLSFPTSLGILPQESGRHDEESTFVIVSDRGVLALGSTQSCRGHIPVDDMSRHATSCTEYLPDKTFVAPFATGSLLPSSRGW